MTNEAMIFDETYKDEDRERRYTMEEWCLIAAHEWGMSGIEFIAKIADAFWTLDQIES